MLTKRIEITNYIAQERHLLRNLVWTEEFFAVIDKVKDTKGIVYTIGNGGSAATASHFAVDMVKTAKRKVISLCDNSGMITAISNDYHFVDCFEKQIKVLAKEGDLLMVLSVSGDSLNLIRGVQAAQRVGVEAIGLLGLNENGIGGTLSKICNLSLIIPSDSYGIVEDLHLATCHIIAREMNIIREKDIKVN